MSAFEPGCDQFLPDKGKIIEMGSKHVDTLSTCDFGIKPIFLGDFSYNDQFFRLVFSSRYTRYNRIGSTSLYISQKAVIAILSDIVSFSQYHFIPEAQIGRAHV